MNRIVLLILLSILSFQCRIFKPSNLDPTEDLGSLQSLLRFLALADAYNTQSQTVLFMKFADSNGTPYVNGIIEYSVYNEADENGIQVSPYGESGNVQTYTATLDASGRAFIFFSERGIANIILKDSSNNFVGSVSFRIYNGITKQSFSILSRNGDAQFILEDLANYRNRLASYESFVPLGSANGRQFIYLQVPRTYFGINDFVSDGYIASSADGENYDLVTKIDGVTLERKVTYETILEISKPVFNGYEYVFFLSEEKRDYPTIANYQSNRNLALRISAFFPPAASSVTSLSLDSNLFLFRDTNFPWMYPVFYFGNGRYLITPTLYTAVEVTPILLHSDFSVNQNMVSGFSCSLADSTRNSVGFQLVTIGGTEYLQCPNSSFPIPSQSIEVRSINGNGLENRAVTFDATPQSFDSYPIFVRGKFVATFGATPIGYTFNSENYLLSSPTLTRSSTPISDFTSTLNNSNTSSILRSVKSSGNADYFLLSTVPSFVTPTIEIFRSTDGLSSVSQIAAPPSLYSTTISNPEQIQSANGKLNYSYSISAGIGIGSLPVYLTYFTRDDGTWEDLPKLIKIR
jgi:hypothetical protein